jgi:dTDP-4-amino-4,6-dideoxygalactose transaminase
MSNCRRKEYERVFGKYVGVPGARAFGLGRQALVILLKALGVKETDRVGVCGFTCSSVAEAVKVCGAIPVYLDVDEYLCIRPEEILRQEAGFLKVVLLQHTLGVPGRLDELLSACKKIGAEVVEDCAHSLDCYWRGVPLGKFGAGAIYSFEWGKPYSTGQGGMLTVNSVELLERVDQQIEELALPASRRSELILECERRVHPFPGWIPKLKGCLQYIWNTLRDKESSNPGREFQLYRGYVRLGGEMTANEGLKQLGNLPKLKNLRREHTAMIEEHLRQAGLPLWPRPEQSDITMLKYPVRTPHRWKILEQARKQGLRITGYFSSPVHPLQGEDLAKVDYKIGSCRKAEDMIEHHVYLPTGPLLNRQELGTMIELICSH